LLVLGGATCCLGSTLPAGYNLGVMNNPAHVRRKPIRDFIEHNVSEIIHCCIFGLQLMQSFCNDSIRERYNVQLSSHELQVLWSVIVSVFLIGGVSGSLIASWLSDRFGRKGALSIGNVCAIVGAILFMFVRTMNSVELFLLGRVIVGELKNR